MDYKEEIYFCNIYSTILEICKMKGKSYNQFLIEFSKKTKYSKQEVELLLNSDKQVEILDLYNICESLEFYNYDYILFAKKDSSIKDFTLNMIEKFLDTKTYQEQLFYLDKITNLIYRKK